MNKTVDKLIKCKKCGKSFSNLGTHINRSHHLTSVEYSKQFPGAKLSSDDYRDRISHSARDRFLKDPTLREKVASRTFDFINNKKLTPLLQRDFKSARNCLKTSLWKPCIILYGSIIEAILMEKYPGTGDFYHAIEIAYKNKDISEKEYHRISLIRDLRNFVHLHRELEEEAGEINEHSAKTFANICESIIRRFKK